MHCSEGSEEASSLASKPTCIICLGMAGSGKTTFVQVNHYINGHMQEMTLIEIFFVHW